MLTPTRDVEVSLGFTIGLAKDNSTLDGPRGCAKSNDWMWQDTGHAPEATVNTVKQRWKKIVVGASCVDVHDSNWFDLWDFNLDELQLKVSVFWWFCHNEKQKKHVDIQYMYKPFKWAQDQMFFSKLSRSQKKVHFFRFHASQCLQGDEGKWKHIRRGEKLQIWRGLQQWLGARACPTFRAAILVNWNDVVWFFEHWKWDFELWLSFKNIIIHA